jgi:alginate O-acetyltransferase complex protein AlgI
VVVNFATLGFFIFLPVVLLGYYVLPGRAYKYRFLLAASWFFYMSWNPWFIWVILFTTIVDYYAGQMIEGAPTLRRKRAWLCLSLVTNLGFLGAFKYTSFLMENGVLVARSFGWQMPDWTRTIILPLGISFHTFQGISYTLDVYRNKIRAVRSFLDFALFVAFFPQLVAGPIVRAVEFLPQMLKPPAATVVQITDGLHWFMLGLFKKVFLADRLAQFVDVVFANPAAFDSSTRVWAIVAYAAQIYCDFSGYSDMAIGCAKWFGFELPRNFNFPYMAESITDFWRRWHISLSTWMRDYLYISLGGSRKGNIRSYFNLLITMTLCGLWHGANWNYVLWGAYNGVLLCGHRIYDRLLKGQGWADRVRSHPVFRTAAVCCTFYLFISGLVPLRSESRAGCWLMESALLGMSATAGATHWLPFWAPVLIGMVALGHLASGLRNVRCTLLEMTPLVRAAAYVSVVVLTVICTPGATKAFIYFQF